MGLKNYKLVWHQQSDGGLVARLESLSKGSDYSPRVTYRYAHVDIYPWHIKRVKNKVLVDMQRGDYECSWHNSIEDAKLYVEALYALADH